MVNETFGYTSTATTMSLINAQRHIKTKRCKHRNETKRLQHRNDTKSGQHSERIGRIKLTNHTLFIDKKRDTFIGKHHRFT
jgi:hypothetical protein